MRTYGLRFARATIGIARFSACLKGLRVFSFSRHALMRFAQVRKFYANFWPIPTRLHRRDKAAIKSARRRMKGGKVKSPRYEPLEQNRLARGGIFRPLAEFFLCPKNDNRRKPLFHFRLFPSACGIFRAPMQIPAQIPAQTLTGNARRAAPILPNQTHRANPDLANPEFTMPLRRPAFRPRSALFLLYKRPVFNNE